MYPNSRPKVIELFAGAGLLGLAFQAEGFELANAVELDPAAAATYRLNLGDRIACADVSQTEASGECDVLLAGPPCQGFSTLNRLRADDPRNNLSLEVIRWAKQLKPAAVVIENVAAFLNASVAARITKMLERMEYAVSCHIFNAYDFGVPQLRLRSFIIATKYSLPEIVPLKMPPVRTVRDAWKGLPRQADGRNWHYAPVPSRLAEARMRVIPPGGDKRDILRTARYLAPPSWHRLGIEVTDVWGRMSWDKPSNTLRTSLQNPSKGRYIHPVLNRVISLREAARLHSIPDSWTFSGKPTQIARQIGNSVPPRLGRAIAVAIRKSLSGRPQSSSSSVSFSL